MRPPMEQPAGEVNPLGSVWTCDGLSADTILQFNAQRRVFLFGGMWWEHKQVLESPSDRSHEDKAFKKAMMT